MKNKKQSQLEPTWIEQEEARRDRDDRHALKRTGQGCLWVIFIVFLLAMFMILV